MANKHLIDLKQRLGRFGSRSQNIVDEIHKELSDATQEGYDVGYNAGYDDGAKAVVDAITVALEHVSSLDALKLKLPELPNG